MDLHESKELIDWLMEKGLDLQDSAAVLCYITCGSTLGVSILNVFIDKNRKEEKTREKYSIPDWGNPITP